MNKSVTCRALHYYICKSSWRAGAYRLIRGGEILRWEHAMRVSLLVINDISQGKLTEAWSSKLFDILETRLSNGLPTLWTCQITIVELKDKNHPPEQRRRGSGGSNHPASITTLSCPPRMIQPMLFPDEERGPLDVIGCSTTHNTESAPEMTAEQFSQSIEELRLDKRYTIFEIASILCRSAETVKNWLYRGQLPDAATREEVVRLLSESAIPSVAVQTEMKKLYNLTWEAKKRRWRLRLTINVGKKVVGKRITVDLKAGDAKSAIQQRIAIINSYGKLGVEVLLRGKR